MGTSQPGHSAILSFLALWEAASPPPWCQRMKTLWWQPSCVACSLLSTNSTYCLPLTISSLPQQPVHSKLWVLLGLAEQQQGLWKLCRRESDVKPCSASHVHELSRYTLSFALQEVVCVMKSPAQQVKQSPRLLLKGNISFAQEAIPSPHAWRELQKGEDKGTDTEI